METIPIIIKHQQKKYNVDLDPSATGEILKFQIFSLTGVEPDRQSVLIKGGKLKDETPLSNLKAKPNQVFMMLGTASGEAGGIVAPVEKAKFLEDMTQAEIAQMEGATPSGLQNLGNTCYLNSTLQVLKSMPEMQQELALYKPNNSAQQNTLQSLMNSGIGGIGSNDIVSQLRDLYKQMSETQEGFPPLTFLNTLRTIYPQFAQKDKTGRGYAQQDAEEAWSQIISQLRTKLQVSPASGSSSSTDEAKTTEKTQAFVDKFMAGQMHASLAPPSTVGDSEPTVETDESFLKLNCHIDNDTAHLSDGLAKGLIETIEKNSPTLNANAEYTRTSRISRLPKYLTVHFVRFFWKRDVNKKAKILKKVTFQEELDVVDYCTPELKAMLVPVRDKVREIRKDEQDMERARKRQKLRHKQEADRAHDEKMRGGVVESAPIAKLREQKEAKEAKELESKTGSASTAAKKVEEPEKGGDLDAYKTDAEYEAEKVAALVAAKRELYNAISPELLKDPHANKSGLYTLHGVITHQGASADSGHYTSYVRKEGKMVDDKDAPGGKRREDGDGKWWWFNDEKVSEVDLERVLALSGGGETHSALILLYRAVDLPDREDVVEEGEGKKDVEMKE